MKKRWIRILPGDIADRLKKTAERDLTEETILADFDLWTDAYKVPITQTEWVPGFLEGLVWRTPKTFTAYLRMDQVEVIKEVEDVET